MSSKAKDNILEKLLELNFELSEKEQQGEKVIGACSPFDDELKTRLDQEAQKLDKLETDVNKIDSGIDKILPKKSRISK